MGGSASGDITGAPASAAEWLRGGCVCHCHVWDFGSHSLCLAWRDRRCEDWPITGVAHTNRQENRGGTVLRYLALGGDTRLALLPTEGP